MMPVVVIAQEVLLQRQLDGLAREKGAVLEYLAQLEREQQQLQAERERQRAVLEERSACLAVAERRLHVAREGQLLEHAARAAAVRRVEEEAERQAETQRRKAKRQRARQEQDIQASAAARGGGEGWIGEERRARGKGRSL